MAPSGLYALTKRTYLDADGKPTTDEAKANELLGIAGEEIPMGRAVELGLVKGDDADAAADQAQGHTLAERTYLDADGTPTTDASRAESLLGNAGDTIPAERAAELGLAEAGSDTPTEPTKDDVMAGHARDLKKLKADDVRALAASLEISTEGNADVVRGRLMEHYSAAYDAERATGSGDNDPDVVDA